LEVLLEKINNPQINKSIHKFLIKMSEKINNSPTEIYSIIPKFVLRFVNLWENI